MRTLLLLLLLPTAASAVEIPIDIGVGPAAYYFSGPLTTRRGALPHFGLKLNIDAVIDRETIAANRNRIPTRYQRAVENLSEVRISKIYIPDALIISPKSRLLDGTGVYGVTFRPASLGVPLVKSGGRSSGVDLDLSAGLLFTYAFIHSDSPEIPTTHFLRPGLDLMLETEIAFSRSFLISLGWASGFYVPQQLGAFGVGPLRQSIFHVGQAFLKLHFRFPHEARL